MSYHARDARYHARDGKVYDERGEEAATARTASGRDLERHDAALQAARRQREATAAERAGR